MNVSEALAQPFMLILILTMGLPTGAQSETQQLFAENTGREIP